MKNSIFLAIILIMASCSPRGNGDAETGKDASANAGEERKSFPVEVKEVLPDTFVHYVKVTGNMEAVRDAFISPETNGQIKTIHVERGERVKPGQTLLSLNTEVTRKNIAEVQTSLELANRVFEKQQELWEKKIGSEMQYLEAKNNKESLEARLGTLQAQLDMATIEAPFSGIVDDILVKEGELASPGMQLMRLVNLDRMRVSAQLSEAYLTSVNKGEQVELRFSAYPEMVLTEPITRLGKVIDPQTRTFTVEVTLDNPGEKLKPNMLTSMKIEDYRNDSAMVIPSISLKEDFEGVFLFTAEDQGSGPRAVKQYVTPGRTVQDKTMIEKGIEKGDRVIIKGYNLVSDGSPVNIVI